jgi:hypothetical protein
MYFPGNTILNYTQPTTHNIIDPSILLNPGRYGSHALGIIAEEIIYHSVADEYLRPLLFSFVNSTTIPPLFFGGTCFKFKAREALSLMFRYTFLPALNENYASHPISITVRRWRLKWFVQTETIDREWIDLVEQLMWARPYRPSDPPEIES